ncbi:MAG TPA: EamA family transporter [Syntrophomonadaceae bacterium]|nr:EamA family transporter [Syntrophomonadaceae bacterium]
MNMDIRKNDISRSGLLNLLVVYLVWSSTYLAIRIAVSGPGSFSILTAGYIRMFLAGALLLLLGLVKKYRLKITARELLSLTVSGGLLWVGGNGLIMWAEQRADSGFAALILALTPVLTAGLNSLLERKLPSFMVCSSLLLSFVGIGVMVGHNRLAGGVIELRSTLGLIGGTLSWVVGSIYQSRQSLDLPASVVSAYQHLTSGIMFLMLAVWSGNYLPGASQGAWLALLYLVLFGSVWAFTAFIKALNLLPLHITMTYAFVNPILAMFLGWVLLKEHIDSQMVVGAFLIIMGVIGLFWERLISVRKKCDGLSASSKSSDL